MAEAATSNTNKTSVATFVEDFNAFFEGDASMEVDDSNRLRVTIRSRTMVIALPAIVCLQATALSDQEP